MKPKPIKFLTDQKLTRVTNILAFIILLVLLVWAAQVLWRRMMYTYTNDAQVSQYINPITSRIGGYVQAVEYIDNQVVKRGDTLLIIDNSEYQFESKQASASIQRESAEIDVLSSQKQILRQEHESISKAVAAADAKFQQQQLEYNRYKYLFDEKSATAQQLEDVEYKLKVYRNEMEGLRHQLEAAEERIADVDVKKAVVGAEKRKWQATAGRKDLDVGYSIIRAPYDGIMGKRTIEKGQMITAGEVLAFIVNTETPKWITANFKETQLRHLFVGQQVEILADAYPDQTFVGKIISISPATGSSFSLLPPDNSTGNFVKIVQRVPVRIELKSGQDEDKLRSGMNVNVSAIN